SPGARHNSPQAGRTVLQPRVSALQPTWDAHPRLKSVKSQKTALLQYHSKPVGPPVPKDEERHLVEWPSQGPPRTPPHHHHWSSPHLQKLAVGHDAALA